MYLLTDSCFYLLHVCAHNRSRYGGLSLKFSSQKSGIRTLSFLFNQPYLLCSFPYILRSIYTYIYRIAFILCNVPDILRHYIPRTVAKCHDCQMRWCHDVAHVTTAMTSCVDVVDEFVERHMSHGCLDWLMWFLIVSWMAHDFVPSSNHVVDSIMRSGRDLRLTCVTLHSHRSCIIIVLFICFLL